MPTAAISLDIRLKKLQSANPNFLAAFEVFIDDFFMELDRVFNAGDIPFLWRIYEEHIQRYNNFQYTPVLAEMVSMANHLPPDEEDALLYHILVEPFIYAKGVSQ